MGFARFPRTPHLSWLGQGKPRDDKVMSEVERITFLAGEVVVEEKVDGANVGLALGPDGRVRVQNRGAFLGPGAHPQFEPLWAWLSARETLIAGALGDALVLFGEWCYAVHSIRYDHLPDWLLGFDVFDRASGRFWSTARRDGFFEQLGIAGVPRLARGRFNESSLVGLLAASHSRLGAALGEGIYLRREDEFWLIDRAKLVRPEVARSMTDHWFHRPLQRNRVELHR